MSPTAQESIPVDELGHWRDSEYPASHPVPPLNVKNWPRQQVTGPQTLTDVDQIMFFGLAMFVFAAVFPTAIAVTFLMDSSFVFWIGRSLPVALISICAAMTGIVVASMLLLRRLAVIRPAAINDSNMAMGTSVILILMGTLLLLTWRPSSASLVDLAGNLKQCHKGGEAANLILTNDILRRIRADPSCVELDSVSLCKGFSATKYTAYLQSLETDWRCGPMCSADAIQAAGKFPNAVSQVTLGVDAGPSTDALFSREATRDYCFPVIANHFKELHSFFGDILLWEGLGLIVLGIIASCVSLGTTLRGQLLSSKV